MNAVEADGVCVNLANLVKLAGDVTKANVILQLVDIADLTDTSD